MSKKESTDAQCREILRQIIHICNADNSGNHIAIGFGQDWGGNTLTIHSESMGHSHVGTPGASFEQLINDLYKLLCLGRGLSFFMEQKRNYKKRS